MNTPHEIHIDFKSWCDRRNAARLPLPLKIGPMRRRNLHPPPRVRMAEAQAHGLETQARCTARAILHVAHHRMADVGHVDPDLMGAAGFEKEPDQGETLGERAVSAIS